MPLVEFPNVYHLSYLHPMQSLFLVIPLSSFRSILASDIFPGVHLWVPYYWWTPSRSGLYPKQWLWYSPDPAYLLYRWCTSLGVGLGREIPITVRSFWVFTSEASMSSFGQFTLLTEYLMTARAYCAFWCVDIVLPIERILQTCLILWWHLEVADFLAFSSWFPCDCTKVLYLFHPFSLKYLPLLTTILSHFSSLNVIQISFL